MRFLCVCVLFSYMSLPTMLQEKSVHSKLMSPATIARREIFMQNPRRFCPVVKTFEVPLQISMEIPDIRFHGNLSSGSDANTCGQAGRQTNVTK
jgi:hypothetical protein